MSYKERVKSIENRIKSLRSVRDLIYTRDSLHILMFDINREIDRLQYLINICEQLEKRIIDKINEVEVEEK